MSKMSRTNLAWLALGMSAWLAGCGGGGGDAGVGPRPSMLPAAPALGDTLEADATTLRPRLGGLSWTYQGTEPTSAGASQAYTNTVTQRDLGGGLVEETQGNVLNSGPDVVTLSAQGGTVTARYVDLLGTGSSEVTTVTELRSPVRVGDQITVVERNDVPLGGDADGDGRNDNADVAIYTRVIGSEPFTVQALALDVQAVRVDTVILVRVLRSSDGRAATPLQTTVSTWYAPDVGIVQRRSTAVDGSGGPGASEVLTQFNGILTPQLAPRAAAR